MIFNFSAGPATLPKPVMKRAQSDFINWNSSGTSVMEISHRSEDFIGVANEAEQDLRDLLSIPESYRVLFCQGGARAQFAAVPLNLLGRSTKATYIDSGYWAKSAIDEARRYCDIDTCDARVTIDEKTAILPATEWRIRSDSAFVHFCPNETIDGLEIFDVPETDECIVSDMSSNILSREIDIEKYGLIFASAQKNIGPAGLCIVIVRNDLLGVARKELPTVLNYGALDEKHSMFNTPPTFSWYLSGLVFKWLKEQGGVKAVEAVNARKAELLYNCIDESSFYCNRIHPRNRSRMNIPFQLAQSRLNNKFLEAAKKRSLLSLKGHSAVGGMRASIYNAMPLEGVEALVAFMKEFEAQHG